VKVMFLRCIIAENLKQNEMAFDKKAYKKAYDEDHKDEIKARNKAYKEAHKDEIKAYYKVHKDEIISRTKTYYKAHKDERKTYLKAHEDERKEYCKTYYESHKDEIKVYCEVHKDERIAYQKVYNKTHKYERKSSLKKYRIKCSINLTDTHICRTLNVQTGLSFSEIKQIPNMILLKKFQIKAMRFVKQQEKLKKLCS
jgi:hypothetical protein